MPAANSKRAEKNEIYSLRRRIMPDSGDSKMSYYSKYNLLKFHVLKILSERRGWVWWMDIYDALPREPKPQPDTFCSYLNKLWKKGKFKSKITEENGNYRRKKSYKRRTYVLKRYIGGKVHYKISSSGVRILKKMNEGLNLKCRSRFL